MFCKFAYKYFIYQCASGDRVEKMISAIYLGELVRLVIVELSKQKQLFKGKLSNKLETTKSFRTEYILEILKDKVGSFKNCRKICTKLDMRKISVRDCINLRYICECVSQRSANIVAAAIAAVVNKVNREDMTVAMEGSLLRMHPSIPQNLEHKVKLLASQDISKIKLILSEEGIAIGAALIAAAIAPATFDRRLSMYPTPLVPQEGLHKNIGVPKEHVHKHAGKH